MLKLIGLIEAYICADLEKKPAQNIEKGQSYGQ